MRKYLPLFIWNIYRCFAEIFIVVLRKYLPLFCWNIYRFFAETFTVVYLKYLPLFCWNIYRCFAEIFTFLLLKYLQLFIWNIYRCFAEIFTVVLLKYLPLFCKDLLPWVISNASKFNGTTESHLRGKWRQCLLYRTIKIKIKNIPSSYEIIKMKYFFLQFWRKIYKKDFCFSVTAFKKAWVSLSIMALLDPSYKRMPSLRPYQPHERG